MMQSRKLLLLAPRTTDLFTLGPALRDAGYLVFPTREHEVCTDAMTRVQPDVLLIDARRFESMDDADDCLGQAKSSGTRVLLFRRIEGKDDAAALTEISGAGLSIVEYSGGARALAGLVAD